MEIKKQIPIFVPNLIFGPTIQSHIVVKDHQHFSITTTINNSPRTRYHASGSTKVPFVPNHHAPILILATNADAATTQETDVMQEQTRHFCPDQVYQLPSKTISYVNVAEFSALLRTHPNRILVDYLIKGLTEGFDIGFNGIMSTTRPKNLLSAMQNKEAVNELINKELVRGHTSGPFESPPFKNLHCSPIGAVIKKNNSYRLIMDLSQPKGQSINEHINKTDFSVQYTHFDVATEMVYVQGQSCYLSKVDVKHAFRLLPVKPSDWPLLGYYWEGSYYIDTLLPFGLRSSQAIFNQFADVECWIIQHVYKLKNIVHYADDFFLVSAQNYNEAKNDLQNLINAFQQLDIPLAAEKIVGPTKKLTYLGIEIDSNDLTISIPDEKYIELMNSLPSWINKKTCTKQKLLSLIGILSFVCKVVRPGRIFLRRLINLSTTVRELHHHITLNKQAQADIKWWYEFLPSWNKKSLIPDNVEILSSDIHLYTDASKIGFGAIYGTAWLQSYWEKGTVEWSIDAQELFAIYVAAITWVPQWAGKRIVFVTDNLPITQIWDVGTTKSTEIMTLIRKLFLCAAKYDFSVSLKHIPGYLNGIADSLSRFQVRRFRQLKPEAEMMPTSIPGAVWDI